ncbi:GAF domain-containing protein [Cryobacterium roopkundense]|uniref:Signal transduction histidine kinase n=1 Tax=Cryobacterium roopkundense TaxID=1001240 RepID=A0A7W8ZWD5_9MICO|nr:GAF domain-containing protein [Cryobacterium roopkundense]MBB5641449.1 signal transduction histidine kinase [Cryobacterium roopkundense]
MVDQPVESPFSTALHPSGTRIEDLLREFVARADELLLTQERIRGLVSAVVSIAEDLSLEAVLKRVVESACTLLRAQYGALGVIGADQSLSHFVTVGFDEQTIEKVGALPVGKGVLGLLIREPHPIRLHDLGQHPSAAGFPANHPPMVSFLGVPVRVRDVVFGNLYLTEKEGGGDFTPEDQELAVALAAAAGVAIENARLFEEARGRGAWLEACADMARDLLRSFDDDGESGLDTVAQRAMIESGASLALIGLPTDEAEKVFCAAGVGDGASALVGRSIVMSSCALAEVRSTGESTVLPLLSEVIDPEVAAENGAWPELGPTLLVALGPPGVGQGVLLLARPLGSGAFSPTDVEMSAVFGSYVALGLELANVHRMREQQAVFGDRDRIARDLHDLVIQRLFAAGLSMQSLRRFTDDPVALDRIAAVTVELDSTIHELRDTIYSLRGASQTSATMSSRILEVIAEGTRSLTFAPNIRLSGPIDADLGEALSENLLAVITEGLSNVTRHSGATTIKISVNAEHGRVRLLIVDDGRGFSDPVRSSGLENLRQRARVCGGRFEVKSALGEGARLSWSAPVPIVTNGGRPGPSPRRQQGGFDAENQVFPAGTPRSL